MSSVELRQVRKPFGGTRIVRGAGVVIADGEFAVLVGPSVCGRSGRLHNPATFEEITEGEIRIGKRVLSDISPKQRDIAMVFRICARYSWSAFIHDLTLIITASENMTGAVKE